MSTKHKSINPETIDFTATSLSTQTWYSITDLSIKPISDSDVIEWYFFNGNPGPALLVSTVLKWIEANKLHVPEDMLPHECDSLKWLDDNFESATRDYFMAVYAEESEVEND